MNSSLRLALLLAVAIVCGASTACQANESGERLQMPTNRARAMKGWELYYRKNSSSKARRFGLMSGTNRQKSANEVQASLTMKTLDELVAVLRRLPPGDCVTVQDHLTPKTMKKLKAECNTLRLTLQ